MSETKIEGNVLTATGTLWEEGSWGSRELGKMHHRLEFFEETEDNYPHIIWHWYPEGETYEETEDMGEEAIRLRISDGAVTDYDGVMSLSSLAVELLVSLGYDCSEVVVE